MMKKRILAAMAASLAACSVFASCGNSASSQPASSSNAESSTNDGSDAQSENESTPTLAEQAIAERTEPQHLVVNWMVWSGAPADIDLVTEKMNELTLPALNIDVDMEVTDSSSRTQQLTLALTGGEQIDIMSCINMTYSNAIQNDYLIDLEEDDLIQNYGQDILDTMSQTYIDACRLDGVLYGVPNQRDMAQGRTGLMVRTDYLKDACEAVGLTPDLESEIWHVDSIDVMYQIIRGLHDTHPEITSVRPGTAVARIPVDQLGNDSYGVLDNWGADSTEVVNMFQMDSYKEYCKNMHELYQYGCISADVVTDTTSVMSGTAAGSWASYFEVLKPGIKNQASRGCNMEMTAIQTGPDSLFSTAVNQFPWTITVNTVDKVAAMQYLNFMYASPEWNDLFCWGVEGVHYVKTDDGHYTFPEGVDGSTSGYNTTMSWLAPAQFKAGIWEGDDLNLWQKLEEFNDNAVVSKANGFIFDLTNVSNQYTAVENVYNEYRRALEYGISDPEPTIEEMNERMMTAGLQDIIDEKQRQLDEFLSYRE